MKKNLTSGRLFDILVTETIEKEEKMSGLIIPVRANGTIAPYPTNPPMSGMSGDDLEGFLAAQGFEVTEEPERRKIGFVAAMNRDEELKRAVEGESVVNI
jgi:hypothetical protein